MGWRRVCQGGRRGIPPPLRRGNGNEYVSALSASFFILTCIVVLLLCREQSWLGWQHVCQGGRRGLPPPLRRGDGNECVSALSASFFDFDTHCLTMVRLAVAQGAEPEEGGRWRSLETPAGRLRCGFAGRGQDGRIRRGIPPAKSKRRPTERAASSGGCGTWPARKESTEPHGNGDCLCFSRVRFYVSTF